MEAIVNPNDRKDLGNVNVSVSIVSHGQASMVAQLLHDVGRVCKSNRVEVILTLNLPEMLPFSEFEFPFLVKLIRNPEPKGFGANHNQAFKDASGNFFCVLNPDIRLLHDPFPILLALLEDTSIGLVAPLVLGATGFTENSFRRFPTPMRIAKKIIKCPAPPDYLVLTDVIYPQWVAGMFMLIRHSLFSDLEGFDERYFLYYEDVDICVRIHLLGYKLAFCPDAKVIHFAQRTSHKNLKYLRWHLTSMIRFFLSSTYRRSRRLP